MLRGSGWGGPSIVVLLCSCCRLFLLYWMMSSGDPSFFDSSQFERPSAAQQVVILSAVYHNCWTKLQQLKGLCWNPYLCQCNLLGIYRSKGRKVETNSLGGLTLSWSTASLEPKDDSLRRPHVSQAAVHPAASGAQVGKCENPRAKKLKCFDWLEHVPMLLQKTSTWFEAKRNYKSLSDWAFQAGG